MSAALKHIGPDSMHNNAAFSQGIVIPAGAGILMNAVDGKGDGKGDIAA